MVCHRNHDRTLYTEESMKFIELFAFLLTFIIIAGIGIILGLICDYIVRWFV